MKRTYSVVKSDEGRRILKAQRNLKKARRAKTTMQALSVRTPFPRLKKCDILYENALTATGASATLALPVGSNDMYDFDRTAGNYFGNKQPLFYDNVLDAAGPYKEYYVGSWETTYWIINQTADAINVWALPPYGATSELDSRAEADNFPGVVKEYLTKSGGSRDYCKITVKGNVKDFTGADTRDAGLIGTYASSPTKTIFGGLLIGSADGTTAVSAYIAVKHVFHAELQWVDALVS